MPKRSRNHGSENQIEILLVEDNPSVIQLIEDAFQSMDCEVTLHTFSNGYDALYFLREQSATESPSIPDLALLNLQVPGKDGCELLETIKEDPQLRRLPSLILTSSDASEDIERCYDAHANAYIKKPTNPDEFAALMESINKFWFKRVQLPPVSR